MRNKANTKRMKLEVVPLAKLSVNESTMIARIISRWILDSHNGKDIARKYLANDSQEGIKNQCTA